MEKWMSELPKSISEYVALRRRIKEVRSANRDPEVEAWWDNCKRHLYSCLVEHLRNDNSDFHRILKDAVEEQSDELAEELSNALTPEQILTMALDRSHKVHQALTVKAVIGGALDLFIDKGIDIPLVNTGS